MIEGIPMGLILAILVAIIAIIFLAKGFVIVQQSQTMVIERLGSYLRTLDPGVNWIIPFVDLPRPIKMRRYSGDGAAPRIEMTKRIDRRETVMDYPAQPMITSDNVSIAVNGAIYYQIVDPHRAVYQVEDFGNAMEVLAKTSLRSLVGTMELDRIFESRDAINERLAQVMDEAGNKWGIKVTRVEIQDIDMPDEVEQAMRAQMTAERNRRAMVTEANGKRESEIAIAEGEKQAAILKADGDKEASILRAQGEKEAIETVLQATHEGELKAGDVVNYLVALQYMKTLPDIAKEGDRVFLPIEATSLLGSIGGVSELLRGVGGGLEPGSPGPSPRR